MWAEQMNGEIQARAKWKLGPRRSRLSSSPGVGMQERVGPEERTGFQLTDWSDGDDNQPLIHEAKKGQKTINNVRIILFFIPSFNRTCFQVFLFVGYH